MQSRTLILMACLTACYAAYNLLVKVSGSEAGSTTSPILATLSLQVAALSVSICYLLTLMARGQSLVLPSKAYMWAIAGGICIGLAEVMYFYLFRGLEGSKPIAAGVAIPLIVGGTIIITAVFSYFVFKEQLNSGQWMGIGLACIGLLVLGAFSK